MITAWITAQYTPSVVNPPLPWSVEPVVPIIEPVVDPVIDPITP